MTEEDSQEDPKKIMAQPPLNLLFNLSLLAKKEIWKVDVVALLQMLLEIINKTHLKDLRVCGIAADSSSIIHRLKVETIFKLEKTAMQKKGIEESKSERPIPQLNIIQVPYRIEPTYPVSLEELMHALENMISHLGTPKIKRKQTGFDPIETFDFDRYLVKFEQVLQSYENMIMDITYADKVIMFRDIVKNMEQIELVRCFIAILYLAMKGKVDLEQIQDSDDIKIVYLDQKNNGNSI